MMAYVLRNTKTGRKFRIMRRIKETGEIVLKGEHAEFTEKFEPEKFKKQGYVLEQEKVDA